MKLTAAGAIADAWAMFRRDHAVLVAVAGPFWFLPSYALALFVPPPPARPGDPDQVLAWLDRFGQWLRAEAPWYVIAWAIGLWGTATVYALYLDRDRPDVRGALRQAMALWPRLALTSAAISVMAGVGLLLWIVPGLYLLGRLLTAGPAVVAERPLSSLAAVGRGFRMSRGFGIALIAIVTAMLGLGWLVSQPLLFVEAGLQGTGGGNPVAVAIVDALIAAVAAASALASALLAVAAYRRLAG